MGFGDGGHVAANADAVAAHHDRALHTVGIEHVGAHCLGVLRAEFEDVARFDAADDLDGGPALRARLAFTHLTQIDVLGHVDVSGDVDASVMPVIFVGAGGEVGAVLESNVDIDRNVVADAHRTERTRTGTQVLDGFVGGGGAHFDRAGRVLELLHVELMVTSYNGDGDLIVEDHDHRLHLALGGGTSFFECLDGSNAWRRELLGLGWAGVIADRVDSRGRPLDVGLIVAVRANNDVILAARRGDHELD